MSQTEIGPATRLLRRISAGDEGARERLIELVYGELRRIAERQLGGVEPRTLQPTALVHEAWLKLAGSGAREFEDRRHFLGFAARAMRSVAVDHARARGARKRTPDEPAQALDRVVDFLEGGEAELLDLDAALEELGRDDPELARLVELRFFAGLSQPEIAEVLGCSLSTVERGWRLARSRLHRRLGGPR